LLLFINLEDFEMKYLSTLLSRFRPVQMFASILLSAVLVFASGCTADTKNTPTARTVQIDNTKGVAKSAATKGTVQLDKIEQKSQEALDAPATSLKTIEERSQGALNEVQGSASQ
jgi:ABC-type uncharacterized transport system auxiliary subunit